MLGVDVGLQHFGLALADGPLATPLPGFDHRTLKSSAAKLLELCARHQAEVIVLGLPTGPIAKLVKELRDALVELGSPSVVLHDESLTSQEAIAKLRAAGAPRRKLEQEHSYAACLILEDYLESL